RTSPRRRSACGAGPPARRERARTASRPSGRRPAARRPGADALRRLVLHPTGWRRGSDASCDSSVEIAVARRAVSRRAAAGPAPDTGTVSSAPDPWGDRRRGGSEALDEREAACAFDAVRGEECRADTAGEERVARRKTLDLLESVHRERA